MKKIKVIALFLAIVMLITFTPISVMKAMADGVEKISLDIKSATEEVSAPLELTVNDEIIGDNYIEKEIVEKRTVNSKQFLMDDGMIMVQNYGVPIHYEQSGQFKEISNSLIAKTENSGKKYFENAANGFKVKIYDRFSSENGISLEKNGYTLKFTLDNRDNETVKESKASVDEADILTDISTGDISEKQTVLDDISRRQLSRELSKNLSVSTIKKIEGTDVVDYSDLKLKLSIQPDVGESALKYENVFNDIDFEYFVNSLGVKENIIVNRPSETGDYIFGFTITAHGLTLVLSGSGKITAYSESEAVFVIPAPNMTDANNVYSEDVHYELKDNENGTYSLKIIPDSKWINDKDRAFPVKIDPIVETVEYKTASGLTIYDGVTPNEYNAENIKFGRVGNDFSNCYMSFPNLNNQFYMSGYQLAYSKLRYYIKSVGNDEGQTKYYLRTVKSSVPLEKVDDDTYFDYQNMPIILEGFATSAQRLNGVQHVSEWKEAYFNPEGFRGCADMVFMWKHMTANRAQHGEVEVFGKNLPSVLNFYVSTVGLKETLLYEQFDYNGGSANVNLINGDLNASFKVLSVDTPTNPLSLELIYNDNYDEVMNEFGMYRMFGNNFKINFQQARLLDTDNGSRFVRYVDADGSIETLCQGVSFGGKSVYTYYSIDKNLTFSSYDEAALYNGATRIFFFDEKPSEISDVSLSDNKKTMYKISYTKNKITSITGYENGRKINYINFIYSGDFVSRAQSFVKESEGSSTYSLLTTIDFAYDQSGNLIYISNNTTRNALYNFAYEGTTLHGITDYDGNGYLFRRTDRTTSYSSIGMSRVERIYGKNPAANNHYNYGYTDFFGDILTTTVTYFEDGKQLGKRNVNKRSTTGMQSEWYENADEETEITTVSSTLSEPTTSQRKYIKKIYSTVKKQNTSVIGTDYLLLQRGETKTCSISSSHGLLQVVGRLYGVSMLIDSAGGVFVDIKINGIKTAGIKTGATKSYFIIPAYFFSPGRAIPIEITNYGNNNVFVSNVSYNYISTSEVEKEIYTTTYKNYVSKVSEHGFNSSSTVNYNAAGQITSSSETDYSSGSAVTKNYAYTYENYPDVTYLEDTDIKRLKSISDGTEETFYDYSSNKTTTTVKKKGISVTKIIAENVGSSGSHYSIRTENGITTRTDYGIRGGNVRPYKVTTGNLELEYDYNYDGEIISVRQGDLVQEIRYENGKESYFVLNTYDNYGLTRSSSDYGLASAIKYNGIPKLSISYDGLGDVDTVSYANGASIKYNYDSRSLQSVELKDSSGGIPTIISYGYGNGNDAISVTQSYNNATQLSYQYSETETTDTTAVSGDVNARYTYTYDAKNGRFKSYEVNLENGTKNRKEDAEYNSDGFVSMYGNSAFSTNYTYDLFNRVDIKSIKFGSEEKARIRYTYYDTINYRPGRMYTIYNYTTGRSQNYDYDSNGYLSKYVNNQNGDNYTYTYDSAGRLISDGMYTYTYDSYNNLTKKTGGGTTYEYAYDRSVRAVLNSVTVNGTTQSFRYDCMGNISSYDNKNLTWTRGNMLEGGTFIAGKAFAYKYDPNNFRYSKTVNGVETLYYWDGDKLVGEKTGDNYTQYVYASDGIVGMIYNDERYYFEKNLFGDVLRAIDENGNAVASFRYDSFGKLLAQSGNMVDRVKFRYRGYYFDDETGFYYLQSRYYDPSLCRFISSDQYELTKSLSKIPGQLNLYAYCNNNPIMYTDEDGEGIITVLAIILGFAGAIAGGTYLGVKAYDAGYTGWNLAGAIALGTVGGGIIGASTGMLIGMYLPEITAFMLSSFNLFNVSSGVGTLASASVVSIEVAATVVAVEFGGSILYAEHKKNARPSTLNKHQKGQTQRLREKRGGEKGDIRRPYKRGRKMSIIYMLLYEILEKNN